MSAGCGDRYFQISNVERCGTDDLTIYFKTNAANEDGELFEHMVLRFFCDDGDDYYPDDLDIDRNESEGTWTGCVQYYYPNVGKLETTILFEVQRSGFPAFHIDKSVAHVCHPACSFATKPSAAANAVTRYVEYGKPPGLFTISRNPRE